MAEMYIEGERGDSIRPAVESTQLPRRNNFKDKFEE